MEIEKDHKRHYPISIMFLWSLRLLLTNINLSVSYHIKSASDNYYYLKAIAALTAFFQPS